MRRNDWKHLLDILQIARELWLCSFSVANSEQWLPRRFNEPQREYRAPCAISQQTRAAV